MSADLYDVIQLVFALISIVFSIFAIHYYKKKSTDFDIDYPLMAQGYAFSMENQDNVIELDSIEYINGSNIQVWESEEAQISSYNANLPGKTLLESADVSNADSSRIMKTLANIDYLKKNSDKVSYDK
jgi:hypothetical protein